jgi:hypothetical protein
LVIDDAKITDETSRLNNFIAKIGASSLETQATEYMVQRFVRRVMKNCFGN